MNFIEVALVGVDKELHVYGIANKQSADAYDENALIFKQEQQNVLYFRVTEEDFRNGYKTYVLSSMWNVAERYSLLN